MDESSPRKKFKLDLGVLDATDDDIATSTLFKAYQQGQLSTSILTKDDQQPCSSSSSSVPPAPVLSTKTTSTAPRAPQPSASAPAQAPQSSASTSAQAPQPSASASAQAPDSKPISPSKRSTGNSLLVNAKQRGNPILKFIRNVAWEFVEMEPDYIMGRNMCALFLSLRYHNFNPNYIHERTKRLAQNFELRVLLVQVDITDPYTALKEITRIAILANLTLMLAWSAEEAGRYLETFKAFEHKPVDLIKEKVNTDVYSQATDFLTTVKAVNKTDTATLLTQFGSMEAIMKADTEELSMCPGLGFQKAKRLHEMFRTPFPRSGR